MRTTRDTALHRLGRRRSLRYWSVLADRADHVGLKQLSEQAELARQLKGDLDRVIGLANLRADLRAGTVDAPSDVDWSWTPGAWHGLLSPSGIVRPESGTKFGEGMALFHDCATAEVSVRQTRQSHGFAVVVETYHFRGSFLSLVLTLPADGLRNMTFSDLVGVRGTMRTERPVEAYARLNLRSGPNTEAEVVPIELDAEGRFLAEFDLSYLEANTSATEKLWIDLILGAPRMNAVTLTGIAVTRRPRAAL